MCRSFGNVNKSLKEEGKEILKKQKNRIMGFDLEGKRNLRNKVKERERRCWNFEIKVL